MPQPPLNTHSTAQPTAATGFSTEAVESENGLLIGLLVTFAIILIGVVSVAVCFALVVVAKKRKSSIRSLQLEASSR